MEEDILDSNGAFSMVPSISSISSSVVIIFTRDVVSTEGVDGTVRGVEMVVTLTVGISVVDPFSESLIALK